MTSARMFLSSRRGELEAGREVTDLEGWSVCCSEPVDLERLSYTESLAWCGMIGCKVYSREC